MRFIILSILYLSVCAVVLAACVSPVNDKRIRYELPNDFEGAVVIFFDQADGVDIRKEGNTSIVTVPESGVVNVKDPISEMDGLPTFEMVKDNGDRSVITYLRLQNQPDTGSSRLYENISEEEKTGHVFSMNYERGSFQSKQGPTRYISFLVCKPKNANLFASRDLNRKIRDFAMSH